MSTATPYEQALQTVQQTTADDQALADAYARYLNGTATDDDINTLTDPSNWDWFLSQGIQIPTRTQIIAARKESQVSGPSSGKPMVFHPATKTRAAYYSDPSTGQQWDEQGNLISSPGGTQGLDPQTGMPYYVEAPAEGQSPPYDSGMATTSGGGGTGGGGGGGVVPYGSSQEYLQQQQAMQQARDQEAIREFNQQYGLNSQQAQQGYLQNRASTGLNLGQFAQSLAHDQYDYAKDPGNYPAYLAMQQHGAGIDQLIGQGTQIAPPAGSNPMNDPRFQNLLSNLYEYAQPGALQTVQGIAAQHGGQLPPEFYAYTHTQDPNVPAHAQGGSQMLSGPVVGIPQDQLQQGQTPQFLAGEAGPEKLTFTPQHHHQTAGMPTPHMHQGGEGKHEHIGSMVRYADGGVATIDPQFTQHQLNASWNAYHGPNEQRADNVYTPAEGTSMSLGKALQPLGYVPSYVTQQLMQGNAPTPGSIPEDVMARLPASLRQLLTAAIQSHVGSTGLQDYAQRAQNYALPGLNSGYASSSYT